jgi:hypothetical protein
MLLISCHLGAFDCCSRWQKSDTSYNMTAMLGCDRAGLSFLDAPMSSKVKIAARLAGEPPDDGGLWICRAEPPPTPAPAQLTIFGTNSSASTSGFYWYRSRQPPRRNLDIHLSVGPQCAGLGGHTPNFVARQIHVLLRRRRDAGDLRHRRLPPC